jgi:hypothetical protein
MDGVNESAPAKVLRKEHLLCGLQFPWILGRSQLYKLHYCVDIHLQVEELNEEHDSTGLEIAKHKMQQ